MPEHAYVRYIAMHAFTIATSRAIMRSDTIQHLTLLLAFLGGGVSAMAQTPTPADLASRDEETRSEARSAEATAESKPASTEPSEPKPYDLWTTKRLTGDWEGIRTDLEDIGISLKLVYNQQFMVNMHGGKETKNGNDFAGSYELNFELDFEKMGLAAGGSFFIRAAKGTWGGDVSDFDKEKIGGLFKTNADAAAEEPIFVDKWWWRQRFLDDRIELRLGNIVTKKDLFDVNKVAGSEDRMFMNAALVANPTIPHKKGLGAYVNAWPTDWLYVRGAVIDAQARPRRTGFHTAFHDEDHFRAFWELGYAPVFESPKGTLPGHYRFGSWYNPGRKTVFMDDLDGLRTPRHESGDVGFYFGCDQLVWKENDNPRDKQGVSVFARYGYARGDVNKIEHFWSAGTQYVGLIPARDKDTLGFGVAQGILSDRFREEVHPAADRETVYELYYACHVSPWLVISPDIQVVTNPGGDRDDRDAVVAGVRLRVSF